MHPCNSPFHLTSLDPTYLAQYLSLSGTNFPLKSLVYDDDDDDEMMMMMMMRLMIDIVRLNIDFIWSYCSCKSTKYVVRKSMF